jgi:hypothetical protein
MTFLNKQVIALNADFSGFAVAPRTKVFFFSLFDCFLGKSTKNYSPF